MRNRLIALAVAALAITPLVVAGTARAAQDGTRPAVRVTGTSICQPRAWKWVDGGQYVLYNDVFATSSATLCETNYGTASFDVSTATTPQDTWNAYPDLFDGCEYSVCAQTGQLGVTVSAIKSLTMTLYTRFGPKATGNDATDFWFWKSDPGRSPGQPNANETMIWLAYRNVQRLRGWAVRIDGLRWWVHPALRCASGTCWHYVAYWLLTPRHESSVTNLNVKTFLTYDEKHHWLAATDWPSSFDAGFECVQHCAGDKITKYVMNIGM